jgi:DNA-binding Lrp family transcriptional regulator
VKLPISKISELTGIHRDTVSKRLADLPFEAGKKGAKLYSSEDALAEMYKTDSLEAARAEQARTAAQLNTIYELKTFGKLESRSQSRFRSMMKSSKPLLRP